MTASARTQRLLFEIYFLLVFAGIGGLQMFGVDGGWLTDYGADFFAPPCLYVVFRRSRLKVSPWQAAVVVFGLCAAWELAQRHDFSGTPLGITRGTFDPWDLVAYAAGLAISYFADVRWFTVPRMATPSK